MQKNFDEKSFKFKCSSPFAALIIFFLFVFLTLGCSPKKIEQTEILWDTWGVPHIFGKDNQGLFYAFGWAQMKSHGNLILKLYGTARGQAAEYWGKSYYDSDCSIHTLGIPERARLWYDLQGEEYQSFLNAFIKGMNDFVTANGNEIDENLKVVLPVKAEDVLAHIQRVVHFTFIGGGAISMAQDWSSKGSNGWAIAPQHSVSGKAMLLANPHLPWSGFFLFYEAQFNTSEINAYGATLVGVPTLAIAFNDYLGWTHTVNTYDGMDLYELTLKGDGYLFDNEIKKFETETQIIKIKQEDGTIKEEELLIRRSVHGPILVEKNGKAVAVRVAGLDKPHLFEQWFEMVSSKNLHDFENALKQMQLPMFNVIYADRDGHIMYLYNGLVPKRDEGDWKYWLGIIPGDKSKTLWTDVHPYEDLPKIVDPPNGWVQNANDPPWTATIPILLDPQNYPPYLSPKGMAFRPQRSARMLTEDDQISFEEVIQYKHSTRMELADRILNDLIPIAKAGEKTLVRKAASVLEKWDRSADATSRGAVLFWAWVREIGYRMFADPWDEKTPLSTPDGLKNPSTALSALERAAKKVIAEYSTLDVQWGDVFRLRYRGQDFAANGGPGSLGIFRVVNYSLDKDNKFRSQSGDSFVAIVEFSDTIRAKVLLSYGNSTQPNSPHVADQLELFSQKKLRQVWRTREQIEKNLELKETF